jgi:hypothetical protein
MNKAIKLVKKFIENINNEDEIMKFVKNIGTKLIMLTITIIQSLNRPPMRKF